LTSGEKRVGPPLSKSELLHQFDRHRIRTNKRPTALVSVSDRPIEALHRAFSIYYNDDEKASDIWIVIISVTVGDNHTSPYHHAEALAHKLGMSPTDSRKFEHEYLFEWEILGQYVEHMVSVETLLNRGLNLDSYLDDHGHLPDLRRFRCLMMEAFLGSPLDGYYVGRELGHMARCFGARAPVKDIAHSILTDCPFWISVDGESQYVEWAIEYDSDTNDYSVKFVDFEHFYWISEGINETLFDSWLADGSFVEDYFAHIKWAKGLTSEMEILRELYLDDLNYEVWIGIDPDWDDARGLQVREQEIMDLIEGDAISIGL
jgi:hypothetical protein